MRYLNSIHSPSDLRKIPEESLEDLCREIRSFLISNVSKTGGHLASNLGAVELTVAIHRVFDTEQDRLVFDVGHQCYVHKLLTGRFDDFGTLRTLGGIAGFPKPAESVHDAYVAGHASTSISVALGMAHAAALENRPGRILCVIGDGSMTGGTAYEGLFDLAASGRPVIVILNDNGMSINPNTGGMGQYLQRLRRKPSYLKLKKNYRAVMNRMPGGLAFYRLTHKIKDRLKRNILHSSLFEQIGLEYSGPVDGHDLSQLEEVLHWAKDLTGPVLVHVITRKGKGYSFAEEDPGRFHGIGPFDPKTGESVRTVLDFASVFGQELCRMADRDRRIVAITAAMKEGTGLGGFAAVYPDRFFDVGIAEEHAAAMAGGMAERGLVPVFAVYSTFLQRAYDMLLQDVAMAQDHVVFAVDRAGFVGADGETHHGLFDISYLSSVPGMAVYAPSSFQELRTMLRRAVETETGPAAVRYPRGGQGRYSACQEADVARLREGTENAIVTYGFSVNDCLAACDELGEAGIETRLIKIGRILPLPEEDILRELEGCRRLFVVEEAVEAGCLGMQIAALLAASGRSPEIRLINAGRRFVTHGSAEQLRALCGLDAAGIVRTVKEAIDGESPS